MNEIYYGYLMDADGMHNGKVPLSGRTEAIEFAKENCDASPIVRITDVLDCTVFDTRDGYVLHDAIGADIPPIEAIRVLVVEPNQQPKDMFVHNKLSPLQEIVGGYIEVVPLDEDTLLICNEEGKLMGLPPNRAMGRDIIVGTFILCGQGCEDFASLTDNQVKEWTEELWDHDLEALNQSGPALQ